MDNVTLRIQRGRSASEGGTKFVVTGEGGVTNSIRRMVVAHAATMNGTGGWAFKAEEGPGWWGLDGHGWKTRDLPASKLSALSA